MKNQTVQKGKIGEAKAINYLQSLGYEIVQTNFRCSFGEIDIIADDGGVLVFVEVKSRKNTDFGYPSEAVGRKKQLSIAKAAVTYIKQKNLFNKPTRFDVVEILGESIRVIKDAFTTNLWY
ncbi:MAG TPA: YraN family protein [Clostridia bacterium]